MQPRSILALLAIAAFVTAAQAASYTWVGGASGHETDWSCGANWSTGDGGFNTYPDGSDDTATIGDRTHDPTLNDGNIDEIGTITINEDGVLTQSSTLTVGTLTVNTGGSIGVNAALTVATLTVNGEMSMNADVTVTSTCTVGVGGTITTGANTLEISGASGMDINGGLINVDHGSGSVVLSGGGASHYIRGANGELRLTLSGSELSITSSATITYTETAGKIEGQDDGAKITVGSGITFTSDINIVGAMQIDATSATFLNHGLVHANRDGTLKLASGTVDDSDGAVRWQVSHADAVLWFNVAAGDLEGNFDVSAGTLDIDEDVTTTGSLTHTGGTIDVASGKCFTYSGGSQGDGC